MAWRPIGVLAGAPEAAPWTILDAGDDRASFYAGAAEIALYRTETGHYRDNLNSGRPSLWVSLRPTSVEPPFDIVGVTADPAEGESFTQIGDDLVEAVPMPPAVQAVVEAFVTELRAKHGLDAATALARYALLLLNTNEFVYLD